MRIRELTAAVLLVTSSASQAAPSDHPISITASGQGQWQMLCHVTPESGEENVRVLEPQRAAFTSTNMRRATCNFKNASTGPTTITIEGAAWACPFPVSDGGTCAKTIAASAFGDFELKRKR